LLRLAFLTYANLLETDRDGKLHVPLSHSPEWGEGSFDALVEDPTCDLALIRFLCHALLAAIQILDWGGELVGRIRQVQEKLVDYPRADNRLLIGSGKSLSVSHRHHSHLMAIYPLGLLGPDGSNDDRALIQGSLAEIRSRGTGGWTGWSFPWMSVIASRARLGNMWWQMLDTYSNLFIKANTLHVNGDPRIFGLTQFTYEPMTLEVGFGAAAAIMEMLMQSYQGCLRLFASIPDRWHDAFFSNLRAEGAFLVSARLMRRKVLFVIVGSEAGGLCKIWNPFGGPATLEQWEQPAMPPRLLQGRLLQFPTERGRRYLLYPANRRPARQDMMPPFLERVRSDQNFYGLKRFARC